MGKGGKRPGAGRKPGSKNKNPMAPRKGREKRETYSVSLPPSLVERVDAITPEGQSRSDLFVQGLERLLDGYESDPHEPGKIPDAPR